MTEFLKPFALQLIQDSRLRWYGFLLSLAHIGNAVYWIQNNFFLNQQKSYHNEAACFPFFPNCDLWRSALGDTFWQLSLITYLALILTSVVLFLIRPNKSVVAMISFMTLNFVSLLLQLSNYNLGNVQLFMLHIVSGIYLFVPSRKHLIPYMIVAFHMSLGLQKLNFEWLSGGGMSFPWLPLSPLHDSLAKTLLIFIPTAELMLPPLLLFARLSVTKGLSLLALISIQIIYGLSYGLPLLLINITVLSYFALEIFSSAKDSTPPRSLQPLVTLKLPKSFYIIITLFILGQALPYALTKDPALSGSPRLFSVNFLETKAECHPLILIQKENTSIHLDRPVQNWGALKNCDPLLYLNMAHQLCRQNRENPEFERLSLSLVSKRITDTKYSKILDMPDFCQRRFPLWSELTNPMGGSQ